VIEIRKYRAGTCDSCKERPAEYSIRGNADEWEAPNRLCQACMLGLVQNNEVIRGVLLLQGGANE
jgi:hypothetical protein